MNRLTTNYEAKEKRPKPEARYHGFATTLNVEKFDLRKSGSDAADEHAVRYFTGLMMDKMINAKGAGSVPWYISASDDEIRRRLDVTLNEGDFVSAANYAMMLHVRKELQK